MKDRVIFAMDGFAGQQMIIDMDNKRILIVNHYSSTLQLEQNCLQSD